MNPGSESNPLRVAVIGAGPAGFYVAEHLFKQELVAEVDMYDRLPTPHGLVRHGVAPDHQKIKMVTKVFDKTAANPRFRFFGNVELGKHIDVAGLGEHYHQVVYTVGAQTDRNLGVPGEDLAGSHSATEFVAWYNGHPDYRDRQFDLSQENVAIVGVGNVAVDVARILCRSAEELATTDIADDALEALRASQVRHVYMLGRRGPAQAAFSVQEIKELGKLPHAQVKVVQEEAEPDALTLAQLDKQSDRPAEQKIEVLRGFAAAADAGKPRTLTIRFLVSPVELRGDADGRVQAMRLVRNELQLQDDGSLRPRATEQFEQLDTGLVFRSVGYHGVPVPGVPFDAKRGVIPNDAGRVTEADRGAQVVGQYVAGWIKRGPTGLIGTNKADAVETVTSMMADLESGKVSSPAQPEAHTAAQWIGRCQPDYFTLEDWQQLDAHEVALGKQAGRPRVKLTTVEQMLAVKAGV